MITLRIITIILLPYAQFSLKTILIFLIQNDKCRLGDAFFRLSRHCSVDTTISYRLINGTINIRIGTVEMVTYYVENWRFFDEFP